MCRSTKTCAVKWLFLKTTYSKRKLATSFNAYLSYHISMRFLVIFGTKKQRLHRVCVLLCVKRLNKNQPLNKPRNPKIARNFVVYKKCLGSLFCVALTLLCVCRVWGRACSALSSANNGAVLPGNIVHHHGEHNRESDATEDAGNQHRCAEHAGHSFVLFGDHLRGVLHAQRTV